MTLEELFDFSPNVENAYSEHLRRHLSGLQEHPELISTVQQVISIDYPIQVDEAKAYELVNMGLVYRQDAGTVTSCLLYKRYFQKYLGRS
jgi:AAA-like domain